MSVAGVSSARWLGRSTGSLLPPFRQSLKALGSLFLPKPGWVTFALTFMVALSVIWSIESARWVQTPTLSYVVFAGITTGLAVALVRVHGLILQVVGLGTGALTILWFLIRFVGAGSWVDGVSVLRERLELWYAAASTAGISTDTLPFAIALVVLVWFLGYVCAWFAFRYRNIWVPLLVAGLGILTNLSYLPNSHTAYFFLFLVFSALAMAWRSALDRHQRWSRQRIRYSPLLGATGMSNAFWFGLLVIIVAMLLPTQMPRPFILKKGYEYLRWPVEHFQGDFNRLFAAVPARKPMAYRVFDNTLPFQGTISLSDEVAFTLRSSRPSYWRVRSYPTYTSKGWVSGATEMVPIYWQPQAATPLTYSEREPVVQQVKLNFSPRLLAAAGVAQESGIDVQVEIPVLPTYDISLADPTPNPALLPEMRSLALQLRALADQEQERKGLTEPLVWETLRKDMKLVSVQYDEAGVLVSISIAWDVPLPLDILSLRSQKRLFSSDTYTVTSSVSVATAEELRQAGEEYPGWVRDIYLQLPDTLPQRVIDLAVSLTAQAETPYDKAEAIIGYLHTLPYTTNIPAPAYDADGVDHFLFNLHTGYSDYFASAMAVMLRAVGTPARMAVGYGLGEQDDQGNVIVRDSNSHGWTEVFFPGYGWVEFEPTPGRQLPGAPSQAATGGFASGGVGTDDAYSDDLLAFPVGTLRRHLGLQPSHVWLWRIGAGVGAFALALIGVAMAFRWLLTMPMSATGVYSKMLRLSTLARLGPRDGQTPREYGGGLARNVPEITLEVTEVVAAYTRNRYGNIGLSKSDEARVMKAWRIMRWPLFATVLRRRPWKKIMVAPWEQTP